jgi:2-methylisocitrate lyase-like PEP mutase family enzyme
MLATMTVARLAQAQSFQELHRREGCFLLPNAWDIGSAKILQAAGFGAIATTSAGVAFSLGRPDYGYHAAEVKVDRDTMLERVGAIASEISVPLSADLEAGYGAAPEAVAETVGLAIAAGAVGGNIEDYRGERGAPLYEFALAVDRIRAARAAIDRSGVPFVLVGRTDSLQLDGPDRLTEAIRRGNAFREAGADCVFAPGAADAETIATLVREIDAPISVVMGLTGARLSVAELAALGVRRVTIGGSLARAMYHQMWQAAREMAEHGTFGYAREQLAQSELNRMFDDRQGG